VNATVTIISPGPGLCGGNGTVTVSNIGNRLLHVRYIVTFGPAT
jgi:hypothetical protein